MASTEQQIDDAVAKRHVQNSDTALGTQSSDLDMNLHKIIGLEDPTGDKDAAHKKYVDDNAGSGGGDVDGPASAIDEAIPVFDGVTGKKIKDSTRLVEDAMTDGDNIPDGHAIKAYGDANWPGDVVGPATHAADYLLQWNSTPNSKIVIEGIPVTTEGKAILASALVKIFVQAEKDKLAAIESEATKYPDTGEQAFLDADHTKLNGIEVTADVTDATNVAAAGAIMDSDWTGTNYIMKGTGAGSFDQVFIDASRIVGRAAAGNIQGLAAAQARTILEFTSPILNKAIPGTFGATTPANVHSNYLKMTGEASIVLQTQFDVTGAITLNWQNGNKYWVKFGAGNITFTFTTPHDSANLILWLRQDGVGSRTVTWPANIKWPGGTEPTLSVGANAVDIISFAYDGGTDYYGIASLNFS